MKTTIRAILALIVFVVLSVHSQNTLQFTDAKTTSEKAIRLSWASNSNEVYRVEYADELIDTNTGTITWHTLYEDYPSQGTNTFWLDTGNYFIDPVAPHPKKKAARFYRVMNVETNSSTSMPVISIISPTNSNIASDELTVTVSAATDQATLLTKLYVDGESMLSSDGSTNYSDSGTNYLVDTYVINTCEWPNGSHTLFATVKTGSGFGDAPNASPVLVGHAVSSFVSVAFSNLITSVSFSEPFFNPDIGQTQQVSAVFVANVNWTLQIQDADTNTVRNASGSGTSLHFNWDGCDDGGTNVPAGIYTYLINAGTNGQSSLLMLGDTFSAMSVGGELTESTELWIMPSDGSRDAMPFAIYPPGFDTNGFTVFEASQSEMNFETASFSLDEVASTEAGAAAAAAAPASQATRAPSRPPTAPMARIVGKFGVVCQDYFPEMLSLANPRNGLSQLRVQIQNSAGPSTYPRLEWGTTEDFVTTMVRGAWQTGFLKKDTDVKISDLQKASMGGGSIFNTSDVSLGLLALHGAYGTSQDFDQASGAGGAMQTYFAVDARPGSSAYLRMSELDFGSPGTNGLKWMALMVCNSLREQNWNSIRDAGWKPFNSNLHLLLGADSIVDAGNLKIWAKYLLGLDNNSKRAILQAWYDSGAFCMHGPISFAVAGYDDCKDDFLTGTNSVTPQGDVFYEKRSVKP